MSSNLNIKTHKQSIYFYLFNSTAIKPEINKSNQRSLLRNNGFTAIEVIMVSVIIAIIAAIAIPSWIGFTNRQRVNALNDSILAALQDAQQQAKRKKLSYSVSFRTENTAAGKVPQIAIYTPGTNPTWENLGKDLEIKPGQMIIGSNIISENTAETSVTYGSPTPQTITFDYIGNLPRSSEIGSQGLIISVGVPESRSSIDAIALTKRCVKIKTLLGAMQTGREDQCNPSPSKI